MDSLKNELIANGFKHYYLGENSINISSDNTMLGHAKVIDNDHVDVAYYNGGYTVTEVIAPETTAKWLRAQSFEPVKQALGRVGMLTLCGWGLHKEGDAYTLTRNVYGAPTPCLASHSCESLDAAVALLAEKIDGGDLMKTEAVRNFIAAHEMFTLVDSWYVYDAYRFKLDREGEALILVVDFAGATIPLYYPRRDLVRMKDCYQMVVLRKIVNLLAERSTLKKWSRARMDKISNYADICAALAKVGYVRKMSNKLVGVDRFKLDILPNERISIEIADGYIIRRRADDGVYDDSTYFKFGTAPEVIIEWIYARAPWLKTMNELQAMLQRWKENSAGDELAAVKKELEAAKNDLAATKKELDATKNLLAQVRAAVE